MAVHARGAYVREIHTYNRYHYTALGTHACQWCEKQPARLYTYTWQYDDFKGDDHFRNSLKFCNLSCHNAYYK